MSLFPVGFARRDVAAAYEVERSLRFRSAVGHYLTRTPTVTGNRRTWTYSAWLKRGALSATMGLLEANAGAAILTAIRLDSTGIIGVQDYNSTTHNLVWNSTALLLDPTSYYHIVVSYTTTSSTAAGACFIWINNVPVPLTFQAALGAYAQNRDSYMNLAAAPMRIGVYNGIQQYLDGQLTEVHFIDGQALTPSDFGTYDTQTGEWVPKEYTGTYGVNGFYLPFKYGSTVTEFGIDCKSNSFHELATTGSVGSNISTADAAFGSSSIRVNGAFGSYVLYPTNSRFNLGAGVFCLRLWVKDLGKVSPPAFNDINTFISQGDNAGNLFWRLSVNNATRRLAWGFTGAAIEVSATYPLSAGVWHELVVTRDSGNFERIFIDGVLVNYRSNTSNYGAVSGLYVHLGSWYDTNYPGVYGVNARAQVLDGYIQDVAMIPGYIPEQYQTSATVLGTQVWTPVAAPWVTNAKLNRSWANTNFYVPAIGTNGSTSMPTLQTYNFTDVNGALSPNTAYDWSQDTPTNKSPVLNPLWIIGAAGGAMTSANQVWQEASGSATWKTRLLTMPFPRTGKWYCEVTVTYSGANPYNVSAVGGFVGLHDGSAAATYTGQTSNTYGYASTGNKYNNGSLSAFGVAWTTDTTVGVAYDADTGQLWFARSNVWQASGNPAGGTNPAFSGVTNGPYFLAVSGFWISPDGTMTMFLNNGVTRPFVYGPPSGFKALNGKDFPTPAIKNPRVHHRTLTYTGNGAGLQVGEIQRNLEPYSVSRSLRFRANASPRLTRTPGVAGNRRLWTMSFWIRRGDLANSSVVFATTIVPANSEETIGIFSTGEFYVNDGAVGLLARSTRLFRDASTFYHLMVVYDSDNPTANDRVRLYCGSELLAKNAGSVGLNRNSYINLAQQHAMGNLATIAQPMDGYLAEVHFVDGQALTPSDFGQLDGNGYWVPKAYTGAYGTNGFYLPFNNTASLATLTADASGNGNNWSSTNISLTAGATYDSMVDVPGNVYATLNPNRPYASSGILSEGNLRSTGTVGLNNTNREATLYSNFPVYFEVTFAPGWSLVGSVWCFGFLTPGVTLGAGAGAGTVVGGVSLAVSNGNWTLTRDVGTSVSLPAFAGTAAGDVVMVAYDPTTGSMWVGKNGTWFNSGNPVTGLNPTMTGIAKTAIIPIIGAYTDVTYTCSFQVNFGQRPFAYTRPSNFLTLSENNVPADPTNIENPGLVWIKNRTAVASHALFDISRGARTYISSNTTGADTTDVNSLIQFNKEGFLLGNSGIVNTLNNNYAAWVWKLPTSPTANNAGSIASQVAVNSEAGVSVVTYTGNGIAGATIGHGLGAVPRLILVKNRTNSALEWLVYHVSAGATNFLLLNSSAASAPSASPWNNTTPGSTVFTVGASANSNQSTFSFVAYVFAEKEGFSRFGTYTGNGSTDGPFVYLGFKPAFVIVKRLNTVGNWRLSDSSRKPTNRTNAILFPNLDIVESIYGSSEGLDYLSNGFKIRTTATDDNANGVLYLYIAFAASPLKYSTAV